MNEDIIARAVSYQQQAEETEQGLGIVAEQMKELGTFREQLGSLQKIQGKEIISNVGNGVFVKASITGEDFFVNVGAGILIKKKPQEVGSIIDAQLKKFRDVQVQLRAQLDMYAHELHGLIGQLEHAKHAHTHD